MRFPFALPDQVKHPVSAVRAPPPLRAGGQPAHCLGTQALHIYPTIHSGGASAHGEQSTANLTSVFKHWAWATGRISRSIYCNCSTIGLVLSRISPPFKQKKMETEQPPRKERAGRRMSTVTVGAVLCSEPVLVNMSR